MSVAALIVAAGRGVRAATESGQPKQYGRLGGEAMLTRTIRAFASHAGIDAVLVAIHPDDADLYAAASKAFAGRLLAPVMGGARRQDSVRAGLEALELHGPDVVLIHDAARPFADDALIARVIGGVGEARAPCPVCRPIRSVAAGGRVTGTVGREDLWRAQTPQGFKFDAILAAHRAAAQDPTLDFTDDTSVAEWFGLDVALVEGSEHNRKLTTAEDLAIADEMLRTEEKRAATSIRVGTGYDVHALGPGDAVILCGVSIPHTKKLVGHSDADVGLHALTDALLGTIADGDIGVHFPPSDERWRGAASDLFLKVAGDKIRARGGEIMHVDVTLLCEAPRIGPYRDAMRACMAETLGIDVGRVSIKATTNEGLGFVGRGEGIAAMATATVKLP
ncbi:2-C-methyl-D-erythritol 4-phosphate cytidylyltransferase [Methyloceanibacter superfactus]|uniref:Bifunctional enzyme IspD/IspF n=1 Tax=Methyloceanibacter superfactus TaxID=1774969 RepID=A0A1E3VST9_9HYPH|nr:bifunctional 2-C-methyl-D-erythritol 4-phosphate cytidylyltransferase/2-C-methyl-D-erythritol 2,4-cyclodiphosphate synthase [Methyloceanibacter superfactus]ODR96371.1 2-C-methyl-D-erythritol 4-phosphate cytidylyltransferase [Methyloceanibacter superfactus]